MYWGGGGAGICLNEKAWGLPFSSLADHGGKGDRFIILSYFKEQYQLAA